MASAAHALTSQTRGEDARVFVCAVILDDGSSPEVAVVRFPNYPREGERFSSHGVWWEIVREGDRLRGHVARPVTRSTCAK